MFEKFKTFFTNNYLAIGVILLFSAVSVLCRGCSNPNHPTVSNITTELNNASAGVDNATTASQQAEKNISSTVERIESARQRTETVRATVSNSEAELDEITKRIRECQVLVEQNIGILEGIRTTSK